MKFKSYSLAIALLISLVASHSLFSQHYLGYTHSNYSGVSRVFYQPAAAVDNRMMVEVNLISNSLMASNNYASINLRELIRNGLPEIDSNYTFQDYRAENIFKRTTTKQKNIYFGADLHGPSVLVQIDRKNAIAVTSRLRTIVNVDNFLKDFVELGLSEFTDSVFYNREFNLNKSRLSGMAWGEIGGTYARVVLNREQHFVKAGITAKFLRGIAAAYLYNEDVAMRFFDSDSLSVNEPTVSTDNATFRVGASDNIPLTGADDDYRFRPSGWGFGMDIGAVYEYRPNYSEYIAEYEDGLDEMRNKNKYMVRAEMAVLDIGGVRFNKHPETYDFALNWQNVNINEQIDLDEDGNWLDSLGATELPGNEDKFGMRLPTSIMLAGDYHPFKDVGFYVNASGYIAFRNYNRGPKVREVGRFTISPRYETKWFEIGIPFSVNAHRYANLGTYLRLGPLFIGSSDVWTYFLRGGELQGFNIFGGMKVPIPYGKGRQVSDMDGDGVYDRVDECIDVPGPSENNGCPYGDKDEDGVLDNADDCIDVPGPIENNGCPYGDKDDDGVLDNVDDCIDVAGPEENNGCPYGDKDEDGVLDNADECIDVPGPKENNGCPYNDKDQDGIPDKDDACIDTPGPVENDGCPYLDTDGDTVLDKDDECPKTPGTVANNGCPELKKEEEDIVKRAFDNLEFDSGKDRIRSNSYPSLNELADLLIKHPEWGLRLEGHTDNVGSDAANMQLSHDRAQSVKDYLVDRGVNPNKIIVEYYGEERPIATNETPEGRQQNRRVEMTIIFE